MVIEGRYGWKAALWSVAFALMAAGMVWFAYQLADPNWQTDGGRGGFLEAIPVWVRVLVFGAFGVLLAALVIYLWAGILTGMRVFRIDEEGVTVFDPVVRREVFVKWSEIESLNDVQGTIVIKVPKAVSMARRVAGTIPNFTNAKKKDVFAAVGHYRPDLVGGAA